MSSRAYSALGWLTWRLARRMVTRKLAGRRARLAAAGVVALVTAAGALLRRDGDHE